MAVTAGRALHKVIQSSVSSDSEQIHLRVDIGDRGSREMLSSTTSFSQQPGGRARVAREAGGCGGQGRIGHTENSKAMNSDNLDWAKQGTSVVRIKSGKAANPSHLSFQENKYLSYYSSGCFNILPNSIKSVEISDILEVRPGYGTDNLQRAAREYSFQTRHPENRCFSVIFTHTKFLHKSVDLCVENKEVRDKWVAVLGHLLSHAKEQRVQFNETEWLRQKFHQADLNKNGSLSFDEVWNLLKKMNLQLSEKYAKAIFRESEVEKTRDGVLNEEEFLNFFERLTERPELRHVLRLASTDGVETITAGELHKFLTEEQGFADVDLKKAESILETFEQIVTDKQKDLLMGVIGLRRLLQSRWGNILKPGHDGVFQDMDQSLTHYYCNSSHNTYLTGLQLRGEATVEGYIAALRKGARLLELDCFDGDHGEPVITHKNTLIQPITLRNTLQAIKRCAFETSPYPVILTLENHMSIVQQKVMVDLVDEILGDMLYKPTRDSGKNLLPSPNQLKRKIVIRGKKIFTSDEVDDYEEHDSPVLEKPPVHHNIPLEPSLSAIIALPSVKIGTNIYDDLQKHPTDGSPSLSENKVHAYYDAAFPLFSYTALRLVKSYPKGLRQDSSNMHPMISWVCGVQSVAMNMQTAGEELDLNTGLFRINGNCGYVLKPQILLEGKDPRSILRPKIVLGIGIISAQYLPKSEPGKDIIDPYVVIQIFGVPKDEHKVKTRTIKDNGFNPTWNESFIFQLHCPEVDMLRFCIKDFDSTSSNDFVGEFSVPVTSIRPGYSQVRLNTGYQHIMDASASLFVRVSIDPA